MIIGFDEKLCIKEETLLDGLRIDKKKAPVISVVGAGGKTTVIEKLAAELAGAGRGVFITTTTHMRYPATGFAVREQGSAGQLRELLYKEKIVYLVREDESQPGKVIGVDEDLLEQLCRTGCPVLIEADGAGERPCKMPAVHEPVIWGGTTMVIGVLGLDSIGRAIGDCCHRPDIVAGYLGKTTAHLVEPLDLVKIAVSNAGLRKAVTEDMEYAVIFNKWNQNTQDELPAVIETGCREGGIERVLWMSFDG